ncbi:MAG: hypothetical protein TUN42_09560 [Dehalogenimonas sp.]
MHQRSNPFERELGSVPLFRFVIHPDSLSEELREPSSEIRRILGLNHFKGIEVLSLPTAAPELKTILEKSSIPVGEYITEDERVDIKLSTGVVLPGIPHKLPNSTQPFIVPSKVTYLDLYGAKNGDYLIVSKNDPLLFCDSNQIQTVISAEAALDYIRIMFSKHGVFFIQPKYPVYLDESFHYLYRFKKLYWAFQYPWTIAVYAPESWAKKNVLEQLLDSLSQRLKFLCRAYDNVAFYSLKNADNATSDNALYHLSFFTMLATGILDNLANIIKEMYDIEVKKQIDITLKISEKNASVKSVFYSELQKKNFGLFEFLSSQPTQKQIQAFYPIRDSLQHRELPKGSRFHFGDPFKSPYSKVVNLFEIRVEAKNRLQSIPEASRCLIKYVIDDFLDPYEFIKWAQHSLVNIVNETLTRIDWEPVISDFPEESQKKIRESQNLCAQGAWQILGFHAEPIL